MTTTVEVDFDADLLAKLRARRPGKDDRTLLEEMARISLGIEALAEVHPRPGQGPCDDASSSR